MLMAGIDTILQNETRRKLLWLKERQAFAWDWRLWRTGIRSIVGARRKGASSGAPKSLSDKRIHFPISYTYRHSSNSLSRAGMRQAKGTRERNALSCDCNQPRPN